MAIVLRGTAALLIAAAAGMLALVVVVLYLAFAREERRGTDRSLVG